MFRTAMAVCLVTSMVVGCGTPAPECTEEGCDGQGQQPVMTPGPPPPGKYEGPKELLSFTVDNPDGQGWGCIPAGSKIPVSITMPLSTGCTVDPAHQDFADYWFTCRITGSGGHYTPVLDPYEDQTFRLSFSSAPVRIGSCSYYAATGTMHDQDNWRDCRSHDWSMTIYSLISCA